MNILVVGAGLLGRRVAEILDNDGHDIAIIDESNDNLLLLSPSFDGVMHVGFPMDIGALKNAGIEACDAVAVTTPDDNLNIAVGQIAKNYLNVNKVIVRISDPDRESVFERFGLTTICPTKLSGETITQAIINPLQSTSVSFGSSTISLYEELAGKQYADLTVKQIESTSGISVFAIKQPSGNIKLRGTISEELTDAEDVIIFCKQID